MKTTAVVVLFLLFVFPIVADARVGVGVGSGKIQVDEELKPGQIYILPTLPVMNTGDEPMDYGVSVEYHEGVFPRCGVEWFKFSPSSFRLEPGTVQTVEISLSIPLKAEPGNYFVYLSAHPVSNSEEGGGGAAIGIAAASKLYFTVAPANIWAGIYYRTVSIFKLYYPWPMVISALALLIILMSIVRKFFSFNIGISLKKKEPEKSVTNETQAPPAQ